MKFGYQNFDEGQIVENYIINENSIIVRFLGGNEKVLGKEYEERVKRLMLFQAIERSTSDELKNTKSMRALYLFTAGFCSLGFCYGLMSNIVSSEKTTDFLAYMVMGLALTLECLSLAHYSNLTKKIKELEKYDIYLSIREKMEQLEDNELDITTIDNYSLNDLKQIRNNLIVNEKREHFYNTRIRNKED